VYVLGSKGAADLDAVLTFDRLGGGERVSEGRDEEGRFLGVSCVVMASTMLKSLIPGTTSAFFFSFLRGEEPGFSRSMTVVEFHDSLCIPKIVTNHPQRPIPVFSFDVPIFATC